MNPLTWPDGLSDATPMPYRVWRVMHHVDGSRPAGEVARLAHTTLADVQASVDEAHRWVGQAVRREQQVGDATARVLLASGAQALASLVQGAAATLSFPDGPEVVLLGGCARSGPPYQPLVEAAIRAAVPGARLVEPAYSTTHGAALNALRAAGITPLPTLRFPKS